MSRRATGSDFLRPKPPLKRGEDNGHAKLKEAQVREIHRLWAAKQHDRESLARIFGVSRQTIWGILCGRLWHHLFPGKQGHSLRRGEGHVAHKLTDEKVRAIRRRLSEGETGASLAREYCVSISVISEIRNRKAWVHI